MPTDNSTPMPVPKTPKKSANEAIRPTMAPPRIVTVGMYRLRTCSMGFSDRLKPGICMPESTSCLATVDGPRPPTSSHVSEKIMEKETRMPV